MSNLNFCSHFLAPTLMPRLLLIVWRSYFCYLACVHIFIRIEDQHLCQKCLLHFYEAKASLIVGRPRITGVVMSTLGWVISCTLRRIIVGPASEQASDVARDLNKVATNPVFDSHPSDDEVALEHILC